AAGRRKTIQFRDAVEWTGIAPLLERAPAGLSGGERQRVAIARALLSNPKLLLLDEPLSAIDEAGRAEILPCLDRLHRELEIPVLLVSHALREIARAADTLMLMDKGRITTVGPLHEVLPKVCASAPDTDPFSVIDAPAIDHDDTYNLSRLHTPFGPLWAGRIAADAGSVVRVQIAARDVSIGLAIDERSSIINQLPARIAAASERAPANMLLHLIPTAGAGPPILAMITRRSWDHLHLATGQTVYARVKGVSILR
ncbi:MAG: ATP-binding cassette domain-containing protein, partial [Candidatus Hydrogenedentes bacterium]|nr:ATP-binding cassette domain-containing protein [Candidatus Hydrogenedentota bacterium]